MKQILARHRCTICSEPHDDAEPCRLVVPSGTPLIAGCMYLRLTDRYVYALAACPASKHGFVGPVFGPLSGVRTSQLSDVRLTSLGDERNMWLPTMNDLVLWDGAYYETCRTFVAEPGEAA